MTLANVHSMIATNDYAGFVSGRVAAESRALSAAWLVRLNEIVPVGLNEVFPTDQLLDHIPVLVGDIALYLRAPADEEIAANATVIAKAQELGVLRHAQRASVHQVLREYEILSEILETFVATETERLSLRPSLPECFELHRRLMRATRTLMRTTVETFVSEYTTTLQEHGERFQAFHRMASHELRSPIGTLLFAGEVLKTDAALSDPTRLAKVAAVVSSNAERLSLLIENLTRLARLGEPVDGPTQQRVDVGSLAEEVARQLHEMAAARNVVIHVADALPSLVTDPARLELVLLNLVSNAIKYSDRAKASCMVSIEPSGDSSDDACTVCVRDNGLGIREADQHAVFERFFRAHAHLDGPSGVTGTGLGLSIVAECMQALGGSVRCESAPGRGTTFFITLPRDACPDA